MSALRVNAWLERKEPVISLQSSLSGSLIAEWRGSAVTELLDEGIVTISELNSMNQRIQQQISHELLLLACSKSLCCHRGTNCFTCITGRLLKNYINAFGQLRPNHCQINSLNRSQAV